MPLSHLFILPNQKSSSPKNSFKHKKEHEDKLGAMVLIHEVLFFKILQEFLIKKYGFIFLILSITIQPI